MSRWWPSCSYRLHTPQERVPGLFSQESEQSPAGLRNPGPAHLWVKSRGWEQLWLHRPWLLPEQAHVRVLVPGLSRLPSGFRGCQQSSTLLIMVSGTSEVL